MVLYSLSHTGDVEPSKKTDAPVKPTEHTAAAKNTIDSSTSQTAFKTASASNLTGTDALTHDPILKATSTDYQLLNNVQFTDSGAIAGSTFNPFSSTAGRNSFSTFSGSQTDAATQPGTQPTDLTNPYYRFNLDGSALNNRDAVNLRDVSSDTS